MRCMPVTISCASTLSVVLIFSGFGRADDSAVRQGTKLLEEGDRLADQAQYTEAVIRYKRAMEKLLPSLQVRSLQARGRGRRDVTKP